MIQLKIYECKKIQSKHFFNYISQVLGLVFVLNSRALFNFIKFGNLEAVKAHLTDPQPILTHQPQDDERQKRQRRKNKLYRDSS